jgi:hypothetical protein
MIAVLIVSWNLAKTAEASSNLTPNEAQAIAAEVYVYGFPMVMGCKTMYAYTVDIYRDR